MSRPRIGITTYARTGSPEAFTLPGGYVDCVRRAGGLPLLLPPGGDGPEELLDHLEGLVLAGGGDLSPASYGGAPHETVYGLSEERDAFELSLAGGALRRESFPLFCICRGLQVLNVHLGGTLHPHLPDLGDHVLEHRLPPREPTSHSARIAPESRLAAVLGATEADVCSWHHQAVDRLGGDLRPVAWAADETVEAVELPGRERLLAVQWHPEMQPDDPIQQRLFETFVSWCRPGRGRLPASGEAPRHARKRDVR